MATSAVTPPPGYSLEDASGAAPSTPNASGGAGITPPPGYSVSDGAPTGPGVTGEITNDVGNKIIVPKDGEDFGDTIKRAIAYHHSLTPQQQQEAQDKETATTPKRRRKPWRAQPRLAFSARPCWRLQERLCWPLMPQFRRGLTLWFRR